MLKKNEMAFYELDEDIKVFRLSRKHLFFMACTSISIGVLLAIFAAAQIFFTASLFISSVLIASGKLSIFVGAYLMTLVHETDSKISKISNAKAISSLCPKRQKEGLQALTFIMRELRKDPINCVVVETLTSDNEKPSRASKGTKEQ